MGALRGGARRAPRRCCTRRAGHSAAWRCGTGCRAERSQDLGTHFAIVVQTNAPERQHDDVPTASRQRPDGVPTGPRLFERASLHPVQRHALAAGLSCSPPSTPPPCIRPGRCLRRKPIRRRHGTASGRRHTLKALEPRRSSRLLKAESPRSECLLVKAALGRRARRRGARSRADISRLVQARLNNE